MSKDKFILEIESATDVGVVRGSNEDYYAIDKKNGLFVVADGLGGHSGGEIASKLAVDTTIKFLRKLPKEDQKDSFTVSIRDAIQEAHENILKETTVNPLLRGMGTTLVLALIKDYRDLYIANVGDSRGYLYRNHKLQLLTRDHSVVAELVKQGEITNEEARIHPQRNIVTQVVGINPLTECFQKKVKLREEDIIILCSDGLWDMISDKEIKDMMIKKSKDPKKLCNDLINAANEAGGKDNITVVIIKVRSNHLTSKYK